METHCKDWLQNFHWNGVCDVQLLWRSTLIWITWLPTTDSEYA